MVSPGAAFLTHSFPATTPFLKSRLSKLNSTLLMLQLTLAFMACGEVERGEGLDRITLQGRGEGRGSKAQMGWARAALSKQGQARPCPRARLHRRQGPQGREGVLGGVLRPQGEGQAAARQDVLKAPGQHHPVQGPAGEAVAHVGDEHVLPGQLHLDTQQDRRRHAAGVQLLGGDREARHLDGEAPLLDFQRGALFAAPILVPPLLEALRPAGRARGRAAAAATPRTTPPRTPAPRRSAPSAACRQCPARS
ncbi:MAG: hypothetical protein J3K34DRAFT_413210 [Monoraphidium minutum]|nr:MAG: hypothetical protein J3K34DRAFT_413210 [Monoraphidium minutum]